MVVKREFFKYAMRLGLGIFIVTSLTAQSAFSSRVSNAEINSACDRINKLSEDFGSDAESKKIKLFEYVYSIVTRDWSNNTQGEWSHFFHCLKVFADKNFGLAQYLVSFEYGSEDGELYDKDNHIYYLKKSAENGVLNALVDISLMYEYEKDLDKIEIIEKKLNEYNIPVISVNLGIYFFFTENIDNIIRLEKSIKYYRNSILAGFDPPVDYYILLMNIYFYKDEKKYFDEIEKICSKLLAVNISYCMEKVFMPDDNETARNLINIISENSSIIINNDKYCKNQNLLGMNCLLEINLRKIICNFLYETKQGKLIYINRLNKVDKFRPCGLYYSFSSKYKLGMRKFFKYNNE